MMWRPWRGGSTASWTTRGCVRPSRTRDSHALNSSPGNKRLRASGRSCKRRLQIPKGTLATAPRWWKLYPFCVATSGLSFIAQEGSHALIGSEAGIGLNQLHKAVSLQHATDHGLPEFHGSHLATA